MARLSKEEMLNKVKTFIGDNNSDEALSLVEDINDTIIENDETEIEILRAENERLKTEKTELDNNWREKYKSRFFDGTPINEKDDDIDEPPKKLTFEDLFKEN